MKTGKVILVLVAEAAAGLLLAILFAPEKGYHTSKKIYQKGEDYAEALLGKSKDFLSGIAKRIAEMREEQLKEIKTA